MGILATSTTTMNWSAVTEVADTIVELVGNVVSMITGNPILLLSIGIGLFYGAVNIVRRFV